MLRPPIIKEDYSRDLSYYYYWTVKKEDDSHTNQKKPSSTLNLEPHTDWLPTSTIISGTWKEGYPKELGYEYVSVFPSDVILLFANADFFERTINYSTVIDWKEGIDAELSEKLLNPEDSNSWAPYSWRRNIFSVSPIGNKIKISGCVTLQAKQVFVIKISAKE
jgi:hypothetical protein